MAQQQRKKVTDTRTAQEGSRWVGERPAPDEVAHWFRNEVRLHEGMRHEDWIGGIVLISSTETSKQLRNGEIVDVQRLVHVPYARVDARIAYFWELCEVRGWTGEIEPATVRRLHEPGYFNEHLPEGFWMFPQQLAEGKVARMLCCTQRVRMYEPNMRTGGLGRIVRATPPATKQLPLANRYGDPDTNVLMKCETGAIGRALGMAGIFVLPGSGVATAEDMADFLGQQGAATSAAGAEPELPDDRPTAGIQSPDTGARISELLAELAEEQPGRMEELEAWAAEKDINLAGPRPSQQRALLRKLEGYFE